MVALLGLAAALSYAVLAWASRQSTPLSLSLFYGCLGAASAACIGAFLLLRKRGVSVADLRWIAVFAVLLRLIGFLGQPIYEDDFYRYLWDGRSFALTGNPYGQPPAVSFSDESVPPEFGDILSRINFPELPTIYGPACELVFLISYWISPAQLWPMKLLFLAADLGLLWILWKLLGPAAGLVLYAWSPLVIKEIAFTSHTDVLAAFLLFAGMERMTAKRFSSAAALLGLAVAARFFVILLVPAILWRQRARIWAIFAGVLLAVYLPFTLRGSSDAASMMTFASGWEFNSFVFAILGHWLGGTAGRVACAALFLAFYFWWFRKYAGTAPIRGDLLLAALFLISPVVNPWYLVLLVPFVALHPSPWGITAVSTVLLAYYTASNLQIPGMGGFDHPWWVRPLELVPVLLAAAAGWRVPSALQFKQAPAVPPR
ncbi:MAG: hypothetical protein ABJF23_20745 [Bryobacteraceae bacterium]